MNVNELKEKLFSKALEKGFEECELFYSDNSSFEVSVYKGKIEKFQNSQSGGFCFRGIYEGKMGYFFSETVDNADADIIIDNAKANAEILSGEDKEFIFEGSKEYPDINVYSEEISKLSAEDKIKYAFEMEKSALEYDSRIEAEASIVATGESSIYISNTKGLNLNEKNNYIMAYVSVLLNSDGETKNKGEMYVSTDLKDFSPQSIGIRAAKKTIEALGGKPVESGKKNIVVKNEVFADILECFCSNFYAENVHKGFSLLKDRLGDKIAGENITVIDNPLLAGGLSTTSFDGEGVATYSKNVIEKGILKTYLYNLKSANKDNVNSTGNGFKSGFKSAVSTSVTNFFIDKGSLSLKEIAEATDEGILITDVAGLHSGANAVSGDFSFAAEGFLIEKGKITTPVNQITIADNFYDVLNKIKLVGSDLKFNSSAIGSPSVMIEDISVAGL